MSVFIVTANTTLRALCIHFSSMTNKYVTF